MTRGGRALWPPLPPALNLLAETAERLALTAGTAAELLLKKGAGGGGQLGGQINKKASSGQACPSAAAWEQPLGCPDKQARLIQPCCFDCSLSLSFNRLLSLSFNRSLSFGFDRPLLAGFQAIAAGLGDSERRSAAGFGSKFYEHSFSLRRENVLSSHLFSPYKKGKSEKNWSLSLKNQQKQAQPPLKRRGRLKTGHDTGQKKQKRQRSQGRCLFFSIFCLLSRSKAVFL